MKAKPKILFVGAEDWQFCIFRLPVAREARDAGWDVAVATCVNSKDDADHIVAEGFRLIPLKDFRRGGLQPWREWSSIRELVRIYRLEKPDIVFHAALKPVLYGSLAARICGLGRTVNSVTGLGYIFISDHLKARFLRLFVRMAFSLLLNRKESRLIVQNHDDLQLFSVSGLVHSDRIRLIRGSGVDINRFRPTPEPEGDKIVVTLVARMLWDKGIAEFVEALRLLKQQGMSFRAQLVGFSDRENQACIPESRLHDWQQEGLVEWLGKREDIPDIMAGSNIVVLPSYREGLPKSLLEAAACGRAIVTTDVPGCREIVRHSVNGLLVPHRDADALAAAIKSLLQNGELRRQMGKVGREMVEQDFSEEKVVRETMAVFHSLLAEDA